MEKSTVLEHIKRLECKCYTLTKENKFLKKDYEDLEKQLKRYKNALNKACEKIARVDKDMAIIIHGHGTEEYSTFDEWKEWSLTELE